MKRKPKATATDLLRYRFEQAGKPSIGDVKDRAVARNGRKVEANAFDWSRPVTYVVADALDAEPSSAYTLECVDVAPVFPKGRKTNTKVDLYIARAMGLDWMPRCIGHIKVGTGR